MSEPIRAVRDPELQNLVRKTSNSKGDVGKTTWADIAIGVFVALMAMKIVGWIETYIEVQVTKHELEKFTTEMKRTRAR